MIKETKVYKASKASKGKQGIQGIQGEIDSLDLKVKYRGTIYKGNRVYRERRWDQKVRPGSNQEQI